MPELFSFLIKVNIALVLFCLGYYLVLRKLTFYTLNRAYLVTAIIFSSVYPFIDLSVFAQRHQEIVAPVQNVVVIWKAPAESLIKQAAYWNWLEVLFWTGAAVFALRLVFQLASLYRIYRRSTPQQIEGQTVRVVDGDISPFSFWQSIYINPEKLSAPDINNIIAHEQIHVKEWHTLDVLLAEISVIFYWFNPGIWLMKRAIRENIEFITDRKILQKGTDSKAYQYSLLNITFNQPAPTVTSSFNFSTLKKRIKMMNAKKSSKITLTRYALLVPMVVLSLFVFSLSKAEVGTKSGVYTTIAAAVKNINGIDLTLDTVPVATKTPRTITVKSESSGKTLSVITVTGTGDNKFSIYADSTAATPQTVTITSSRPNQKDSVITFTMLSKPMGFTTISDAKTTSLTGNQLNAGTINADNKAIAAQNYSITYNYKRDSTNRTFTYKMGDVNLTTSNLSFNINNDMAVSLSAKSSFNAGKGQPNIGEYKVITTTNGGSQVDDAKQPLFVVDGKEVNQKDLKSFSGSVIYLSGDTATDKYGEKGKNGVVVITTKKK